MNVEDVFSSRLRIKIVKLLMQMSELNISEIARRLGINHNAASKHLQVLEEEGILQQKVFGRIRMYRIKENSPKAKAIQNLIETWEPNLQ